MAFPHHLAVTVSALLGLAAAPAQATVEAVSPSEYTPAGVYGGFNIQSTNGALQTTSDIGDAGLAGRFSDTLRDTVTGLSVQEYTFCVDALTHFYTFDPYNINSISSITTDTIKQAQLAGVLSHASGVIGAAANPGNAAAGLQLAVWAIVYDPNVTDYQLSAATNSYLVDNFNTYGDFGAGTQPYALGTTYLGNVENGTWTGDPTLLRALVQVAGDNPATQNQIFIIPAVPEPATWLSMILGLGILGAALRRRPRAVALGTTAN